MVKKMKKKTPFEVFTCGDIACRHVTYGSYSASLTIVVTGLTPRAKSLAGEHTTDPNVIYFFPGTCVHGFMRGALRHLRTERFMKTTLTGMWTGIWDCSMLVRNHIIFSSIRFTAVVESFSSLPWERQDGKLFCILYIYETHTHSAGRELRYFQKWPSNPHIPIQPRTHTDSGGNCGVWY